MTSVSELEPLIPSERGIEKSELPNLVIDLERKAAALEGKINPGVAQVLEEHMRVINSYYSNLIEGHNTHPHDIRKAMEGKYSEDPAKRDLQLESLAHISVQEQLRDLAVSPIDLLKPQCFNDIHRMFYEKLPDRLRFVYGEDGNQKEVVPGLFRQHGEEVSVGRHIPPKATHIGPLLKRFTEAYRLDYVHGQKRLIAVMAAHHRFAWIHPFLDGNGRVGRLHTDLFLKTIGLGASGVWCLSRGLARNNKDYKIALATADQPRQRDHDGRGALSENNLISFCQFMIKTGIDQVEYMSSILDLHGMTQRIQRYIEDRNKGLIIGLEKIKPEAVRLIEKAYMFGEFPRSEITSISGLGSSVTRKIVQQLKEDGLLSETSSRSPLKWAIPEHAERYYLPELSPTH